MTLPASGRIRIVEVAIELGNAGSTRVSLTSPEVRALAGKPSGRIALSDLYGKSRFPAAGTLSGGQYCSGVNLYQNYHNGSGGTYASLVQANSPSCGYVPPPPPPPPPAALSASPEHDTGGSYDSDIRGGTINTRPSVFVSGGTTPYNFLWTFIENPGSYAIDNPAAWTPVVSRTFVKGSNNEYNATLNCRVRDSLGQEVNVTVFVSATTGIGY